MTYLIPTICKLILLVYSMSLVIQTLSRFGVLTQNLKLLSQADAELLACAQHKANLRNIEWSYYYLSSKIPHLRNELRIRREALKAVIHEHQNSCSHPHFKSIHASSHLQTNSKLPEFWPNWILAIRETFP